MSEALGCRLEVDEVASSSAGLVASGRGCLDVGLCPRGVDFLGRW